MWYVSIRIDFSFPNYDLKNVLIKKSHFLKSFIFPGGYTFGAGVTTSVLNMVGYVPSRRLALHYIEQDEGRAHIGKYELISSSTVDDFLFILISLYAPCMLKHKVVKLQVSYTDCLYWHSGQLSSQLAHHYWIQRFLQPR